MRTSVNICSSLNTVRLHEPDDQMASSRPNVASPSRSAIPSTLLKIWRDLRVSDTSSEADRQCASRPHRSTLFRDVQIDLRRIDRTPAEGTGFLVRVHAKEPKGEDLLPGHAAGRHSCG